MSGAPPYESIETLFLDVGNTLVSIDFDWIERELSMRNIECTAQRLRRAEAAARPLLSSRLAGTAGAAKVDFSFPAYLDEVLTQLDDAGLEEVSVRAALVETLALVLHTPGQSSRLWSWVLPDVPEALQLLRATGLQLVVVSNSDGTVEQGLRKQGLHHYFDTIVDSHCVGFEKPDPRIFTHALDASGASPEATLHVGDLYSADVVGARRAGVHPLLLDPFDDWGELDCPKLPDLMALAKLLERARV
jgi:HAD superfamily hydrolase (TIGR01509 family)